MSKTRWWRPVMVTAVAATAVAVSVPAMVSAAAARPAAGPRVPVLHWRSCASGFQCANARVPLNYRHPRGATIRIAVMRHRAAGRRLGSMFFNQGGPADQLDTFPQAYQQIPATIRARYDVVSFDPRGFGESTAIRCFPTQADENRALSHLPLFPVGRGQQKSWERTVAAIDARCARTRDPLLAHDSSADVARDMNLLRQAVGDRVLNYYGESYGTGLGAIYANLFPARTGRMIFDGNISLAEWSNDRGLVPGLRDRSDVADAQTMAAFLKFCGRVTTSTCAFTAGTPAATTAKWNQLLSRLRHRNVASDQPKVVWTYADVLTDFPEYQFASWPDDAALLQQLWVNSAPGHTIPPGTPLLQPLAGVRLEQILAVGCSDVPSPRNPAAYVRAARVGYARSGGFGLYEAWHYAPCAWWPRQAATDHYAGPWNRRTASPILVIGNTTDPATPYSNSVAMARDLARARLLTVHGYGHTEITNPSACAAKYEARYMITGALPLAGTVCQQDATPFGVQG